MLYITQGTEVTIYLIASDDIGRLVNLRDVEENIANDLDFPLGRLPVALTPGRFYDAKRKQYHSTAILKELLHNLPPDADKALGIVSFDLFVPILTFVFGEAQLNGKVAVVSTARLEQTFYGLPPNQPLLHRRLIKEMKHELGHTFGLRHCPQKSCVMSLAANVSDVDLKGLTFCRACKELLRDSTP
jgi:archaemetzincin